jgi:hypothetical protein
MSLLQLDSAAQVLLRSNIIGAFQRIVAAMGVAHFDELHSHEYATYLRVLRKSDEEVAVYAQAFGALRYGAAESLTRANVSEPHISAAGNQHRILARYLASTIPAIRPTPGEDEFMFFIMLNGLVAMQVGGVASTPDVPPFVPVS